MPQFRALALNINGPCICSGRCRTHDCRQRRSDGAHVDEPQISALSHALAYDEEGRLQIDRSGEIAVQAGYGEPDVADLAAAYAFGIAQNHPFVDGNKRTAAVVSETLLMLNGSELIATDAELVVAFVALAGGEMSEVEMADWFRQHIQ